MLNTLQQHIASTKRLTPLIAMVATFIVPIVIASILFQNIDKINLKTTENGIFIDPPLQLNPNLKIVSLDVHNRQDLEKAPNANRTINENTTINGKTAIDIENKTQNLGSYLHNPANKAFFLLFLEPKICDAECAQRKKTIANIKIALHAKKSFLLTMGTTDISNINNLDRNHSFEIGTILLLDPQLKTIMQYKPNIDASKILKDVKKLLKNKREF